MGLIRKKYNVTKNMKLRLESCYPLSRHSDCFCLIFDQATIFKAVSTAIEVLIIEKENINKNLNNEILPIIQKTPPPSSKGKYIKIKFCTQLPTNYPQFVFFCNLPQYLKDPYRRFLENKIRSKFDFQGVPIQIFFRKK